MSTPVIDKLHSDASDGLVGRLVGTSGALNDLKRTLEAALSEDHGAPETGKLTEEKRLAEAIAAFYGGSELMSHEDTCTDLATQLWAYWEGHHDQRALQACIEVERDNLQLRPPGHPQRVASCVNLAVSLLACYDETGDVQMLDGAIEIQQEALDLPPVEHPDRASLCSKLAASLHKCHGRTGDSKLLDKAIELNREALELRPPGHPNRDVSCSNLATSLSERFKETGSGELLTEIVQLEQEALDLCPNGHPARAISCANLAISLKALYKQTGDETLLDRAIMLEEEALHLRPVGHRDRVRSCKNLAVLLKMRYKQRGDGSLLDQIIELDQELLGLLVAVHPRQFRMYNELAVLLRTRYGQTKDYVLIGKAIGLDRKALVLCPAGHQDRFRLCTSLAHSLQIAYNRTEDLILMDEAVELCQEVLELCPVGHPHRAESCSNLAISHWKRYNRTKDNAALNRAIELQQEVLDLCPAGHLHRAESCGALAKFLKERFNQTGDSTLLERIIVLEQEVLKLRPAGHPSRATAYTGLAISIYARYRQTGDSTLLDRAIELNQEALQLCPAGHPDRARACSNIGTFLRSLYRHTGDGILLHQAIALQEDALQLRPAGHVSRAESCANLGMLLHMQYSQQKEDDALLDRAIRLKQEAIDLCPVGHPSRHSACTSLAVSLLARYTKTGASALLSQVITLDAEALELRPAGHPEHAQSCANLALALRSCYRQSKDHAALDKAIELNQEARLSTPLGHPERWRYSMQLAHLSRLLPSGPDLEAVVGYLSEVFDASSYDDIALVLKNAIEVLLRIDVTLVSSQQQHVILELHAKAVDTVTLAAGLPIDTSTQLRHILRGSGLGPAALSLATRLHNRSLGLQLLERARGVIWSQMLHMRDPQVEHVPGRLASQLHDLLPVVATSEHGLHSEPLSSTFPERSFDYAQRNRLQDVIQQIRSLPGLSDFMRGPNIASLLNVATKNPVVILVADQRDCYALIITISKEPLSHLPMPGVTRQTLENLTFERVASQKRGASELVDMTRGLNISKGSSAPHARLAQLWRAIVKPVIEHLSLTKAQGRARSRVHWCPTGPFASVPVHAAGIYEGPNQECCSDYVVSSYTPTLTALIQARRVPFMLPVEQIRLTTVGVEDAHDSNMPRLRNVVPETRHVLDMARKAQVLSSVDAATAGKNELVKMFQSSQILHLACHGIQHREEPHKSHFCLRTGNLTITELMDMKLKNAFFAFLSACETAKGDKIHTDEAVHLAAAMLFAGFKSVVATMWAMNDADGPYMAREFYERLFGNPMIDEDSVPYALDEAVTALRKQGVSTDRWATFIHMGA